MPRLPRAAALLLLLAAATALGGCEDLWRDPARSIGTGIKGWCRTQPNCTVHDGETPEPAGR